MILSPPSPATLPRWWPHFVWVTAAAVVLDLGGIHGYHHADSFMPVLASLYKWTFYYWEQNRYGMLVALLATPFDHPFTNLLVQNGITIWAGLMCFPLASRLFVPGRGWSLAGPLAAAAFVAFVPPKVQWVFFTTANVFSVSLALGLAGLLATRAAWPGAARAAVTIVCFALGSWVNSGLGLVLFPVVVLTALARWATADLPLRATKPEGWWDRVARHPVVPALVPGAAACLFGVLLAMGLHRVSPYQTTVVTVPPVAEWWPQIEFLADSVRVELCPRAWAVFLCACVGAGGVLAVDRPTRAEARRGLVIVAAVTAAAIAYGLLMTVLFLGHWRYPLPAAVLVHVAVVAAVVRPLAARAPRVAGRGAELASCAAVVVAAVATFGWPSVAGVERDVRQRCNPGVDDLIAAHCTHVAGDYWRVWRTVYGVNWAYADRGDPRRIWGLAFRCEPTAAGWKAVPLAEMRVGTFDGDDESAALYLKRTGVPMVPVERHGSITVYVPAQYTPRAGGDAAVLTTNHKPRANR